MALPIPEKTWNYFNGRAPNDSFNVNTSYTASAVNRYFLYSIKQALVSFGWTVKCSYPGFNRYYVPYGSGSDSDTWSSYKNMGYSAWTVLKNTTLHTNFEMLLSHCSKDEGGGGYAHRISDCFINFDQSPGFTRSGDSFTTPSRAYKFIDKLWTNFTDVYNPIAMIITGSSDGYCTRIMTFTNSVLTNFVAIEKVKNPSTFDGYTYNDGYGHNVLMITAPQLTPTYARLNDNMSVISQINKTDGTSTTLTSYCMTEGVNGTALGETLSYKGELNDGFLLTPIELFIGTKGYRNKVGDMYDMWFGPNAYLNAGDTFPNTGTLHQFIYIGNIVIPWDSSTVPVIS